MGKISAIKSKGNAGIFISILLVALVVGGCNTATTTSTVASAGREYFPNTEGYSWTYQATSFFAPTNYSLSLTFSGTAAVDSLVVQKQRYDYQDQIFPTMEALIAVNDLAVLSYGTTQSSTTSAFVTLDFPLTIGKTWFTEVTNEAEVITRESVTVPAGTFDDCLLVKYTFGSRQTNYYWYARNVGLVKGISIHVDGTGTLELTSKNF